MYPFSCSETQMMSNNGFHPLWYVIDIGEEAARLIEIAQLMKDISLSILGKGICDFFFGEPTRLHHGAVMRGTKVLLSRVYKTISNM